MVTFGKRDFQIELAFPNLRLTGYSLTSPKDDNYNCIGWAAEDSNKFWWPVGGFWPNENDRELSVACFLRAFSAFGYEECPDESFEEGCMKLALYTDPTGEPTHMARQLSDGGWTSKLGRHVDIFHAEVRGLEGPDPAYGRATVYLKRVAPQETPGLLQ